VHATRLRTEDEALVALVLGADTILNLFLLGMLRERGIRANSGEVWIGAVDGRSGGLRGVALAMGFDGRRDADLVVPWGGAEAAGVMGEALGRICGVRSLVGPREAGDALWAALGERPCRVRYAQRLFCCTTPAAGPRLAVRPARADEVARMVDWSERMNVEDLGERPWGASRAAFAESVRSRVEHGLVLVAEQDGAPCFKVDLGTRLPEGVQVGGTFVPPELRGRGIATAAMRGVCALLLRRHAVVSLHANEANLGAVRAYKAAGFLPQDPMRLCIAG
jgi:uncharacterized protein